MGSPRPSRYGEKLATPDITIADLIGEVNPIKVAEGRYLSDNMTIHYGMVPRTNRGIFCMNELPDLAERIQVGLLNIMEERDVQIRGYEVRPALNILRRGGGQPGGLHEPRADHHPAQGSFRRPDPHPLPAGVDHRGRNHAPGGASLSTAMGHAVVQSPTTCRSVAELTQLARRTRRSTGAGVSCGRIANTKTSSANAPAPRHCAPARSRRWRA